MPEEMGEVGCREDSRILQNRKKQDFGKSGVGVVSEFRNSFSSIFDHTPVLIVARRTFSF
jgi:hypothetical protein